MTSPSKPEFVSETITPEPASSDLSAMSRGEPGVPSSFVWRDQRYVVARVVASRRAMGEDRGDVYVRRHYYDIETSDGVRMTLYFERNPSDRTKRKRWWLYTLSAPEPLLETARLQLRCWTYADREAFKQMVFDPDAMRYVHDSRPLTPREAEEALRNTIERYARGFGDWAILQKNDAGIMGESGLAVREEGGDIEIGWMLRRPHWGQGFAFEAASAVLKYAFEELRLERLIALTRPDNDRSIRLIDKLGMRYEGTTEHRGYEMRKYSIERALEKP